jgi:hypothetical protein
VKFLNNDKELINNPLLKQLMLFLVVVLMLFLLSDIALHHYQIGLTLNQTTETIMGNEENFTDPILFDSLLERLHIDILTSMLTLMLLAVILIRLTPKAKQYTIHIAFISAILTQFSLLLSFYFKPFILIWIGLFILWHLVAFQMSIKSIWRLYK